jgi:ribose 5-phosphate isomerase B
MRIAIASDHGGFPLYRSVMEEVSRLGHEAVGVNPQETIQPNDDYPDYAVLIGEQIRIGRCERGILVCGSGVGAAVAANKLIGIRAGLCHDTYSAHQGVEHDDINVLCLGARVVGVELALELVRAFVNAKFSGAERHRRRLEEIKKLEESR